MRSNHVSIYVYIMHTALEVVS